MIALALNGVTAFSTMPLRLITLIGFVVSSFLPNGSLSTFGSLLARCSWLGFNRYPVYLMCGVQLVCLGIMGEYIGKIYHETKRRPRYTIDAALPENDKKWSEPSLAQDP